ncbi:MAG: hypothetical protein AAB352_02175 [Patescibacteria group bacterium]
MNLKHIAIVVIVAILVAGIGLWLNYYLVLNGKISVPVVEAPLIK